MFTHSSDKRGVSPQQTEANKTDPQCDSPTINHNPGQSSTEV